MTFQGRKDGGALLVRSNRAQHASQKYFTHHETNYMFVFEENNPMATAAKSVTSAGVIVLDDAGVVDVRPVALGRPCRQIIFKLSFSQK